MDQDSQRSESLKAARMMVRDMEPQCARLLRQVEHLKSGQLYKSDPAVEPTSGLVLGGALSRGGLRRGMGDLRTGVENREVRIGQEGR